MNEPSDKQVQFHAPAHHTLRVGDVVIRGGETATIPAATADQLLTAPYIDVTEVKAEPGADRAVPAEKPSNPPVTAKPVPTPIPKEKK